MRCLIARNSQNQKSIRTKRQWISSVGTDHGVNNTSRQRRGICNDAGEHQITRVEAYRSAYNSNRIDTLSLYA